MLRKVTIVIAVLFAFTQGVNAQDQFNGDQLFCRVLNKESKAPVFYATIKLKGTNRGLIADDKGQFRLPPGLKGSEIISLSSIGYKTKEIFIKELQKDRVTVIYLEPNIENLEAVTLVSGKKKPRKPSARQIVKKALHNISVNYPKTAFSYIGYYRDYQQPLDDTYAKLSDQQEAEYINLNEGIIEVFDAGFGTDYFANEQNQTLIYSYNQNPDFIRDKTLTIPYDNQKKKYLENVIITPFGGNELNILKTINAIRNHDKMSFSFVNAFEKNFTENHLFRIESISYLQDIPIYEISFSTKIDATGIFHYAKGKIFISKGDFAIHKLNYSIYEQNIKKPLCAITIEYAPLGEKMYLNYITFNNKFQSDSDHYFKVKNVVFDIENTSFDVYFNRGLDESSITSINNKFRLTYKEEIIEIINVLIFNDHLRIIVDNEQLFSLPDFKLEKLSTHIKLKIKNIKDVKGNVLNDIPKVLVNQYREIFVQEVFPGKKIDDTLEVMNKYAPLSKSKIYPFREINKYWVNTPLKNKKTN